MNDLSANIKLNTILLEARNILADMERCRDSKLRQIEHSFQTMNDNIPKDLQNFQIQMTIEQYLMTLTKKAFGALVSDDDDDESIDDNEEFDEEKNIVDVEYDKKLTSTVMKVNPIKNLNLNKLKQVINEQSIIQEQSEINVKPKSNKTDGKNEDFSIGIFYYLKDGTKAYEKLKDLKSIDVKNVHEKCVDELTNMIRLMSTNGGKKI